MPITSFIVLIGVFLVVALIYIELASMPGSIARNRNHPQAAAINLLGWIGLLLGAAPWLVALIWANMRPIATMVEAPGTRGKPEDNGHATTDANDDSKDSKKKKNKKRTFKKKKDEEQNAN